MDHISADQSEGIWGECRREGKHIYEQHVGRKGVKVAEMAFAVQQRSLNQERNC
jgi:hypothetical protein